MARTLTQVSRVLLNGVPVNLDPNKVVGKPGGEGTVYRVSFPGPRLQTQETAVKVYHTLPTVLRRRKLESLIQLTPKLPPEVVAPEQLAYSESGAHCVGFSMRLLIGGYQKLEMLFSRKYRETNDISTRDVIDLFLKLRRALNALHQNQILVGDLNPFNELFKGLEIALIDADSFQFGPFPCEVAMEGFLNPRLYGVDLSQKPVFRPEDDDYAYDTLLFNALLLVHPYGGAHRQVRTVTQRAKARIPVFGKDVIFPVSAYPLELLTDELLQVFDNAFTKGQIEAPETKLLENYRSILIGCSTCGLWYPHHLTECPGCQAVNRMIVRLGTAVKAVRSTELMNVRGKVLALRVLGTTLYAVAREKGLAVVYIKESLKSARTLVLGQAINGARYDFFGGVYLAVCEEPYQPEAALSIFDLSGKGPVLVTTTLTESYAGNAAVFRGSAKFLYRVFGGHLLRGQILFGNKLVEEAVASVTDHQAWFDSAPAAEVACGFYQVFSRYEWFLVRKTAQDRIDLPSLENGEALLDHSVRFAHNSLLILRRTEIKGISYCRLDVVSSETAEVTGSRRVKILDEPHLAQIHTPAFAGGTLLLPTDTDGLLAEGAVSGKQRFFADTKPFVDATSRVYSFEDGILTLTGNRAIKLVLTNPPP